MANAEKSWIYFGGVDTAPLVISAPAETVRTQLERAHRSDALCQLIEDAEQIAVQVNPQRVTFVRPAP